MLILNDRRTGKLYLRLLDGWLEADNITGQWKLAGSVPEQLNKALAIATASKQVDLLAGPSAETGTTKISLKNLAAQNPPPEVYVSTVRPSYYRRR